MDNQPRQLTKRSLQILDLLSEYSDLGKVIFEAFLNRVTGLLHVLLSKVEESQMGASVDSGDSDEVDDLCEMLQHANLILWRLFSDTQQIHAEHLCQSSEFTKMVLKLNSKTLSGNYGESVHRCVCTG